MVVSRLTLSFNLCFLSAAEVERREPHRTAPRHTALTSHRTAPHRCPEGFRFGSGRQDAISPSKKCLKMTAGKRIKTIMPLSSPGFLEKISSPEEKPFRPELSSLLTWSLHILLSVLTGEEEGGAAGWWWRRGGLNPKLELIFGLSLFAGSEHLWEENVVLQTPGPVCPPFSRPDVFYQSHSFFFLGLKNKIPTELKSNKCLSWQQVATTAQYSFLL